MALNTKLEKVLRVGGGLEKVFQYQILAVANSNMDPCPNSGYKIIKRSQISLNL